MLEVGLFWYNSYTRKVSGKEDSINVNKYLADLKLQGITPRRGITTSRVHFARWEYYNDKYFREPSVTNYMYYPRGRVTYFLNGDWFEIRLCQCLFDNVKARRKILKAYGLAKAKNVKWVPNPQDEG